MSENGIGGLEPKRGDRVRVSVVGTYIGHDADGIRLRPGDGTGDMWLSNDSTIEVLTPDEPPLGSVVIGWADPSSTHEPLAMNVYTHAYDDVKDPDGWRSIDGWASWRVVEERTRAGRRIILPTP